MRHFTHIQNKITHSFLEYSFCSCYNTSHTIWLQSSHCCTNSHTIWLWNSSFSSTNVRFTSASWRNSNCIDLCMQSLTTVIPFISRILLTSHHPHICPYLHEKESVQAQKPYLKICSKQRKRPIFFVNGKPLLWSE